MIYLRKTATAPASLANQQSYTEQDVLDQLFADFHEKCYLCEQAELTKVEIDHFEPHHNRTKAHLVFDWNNLFYSCGHCNGTKSNTFPIHNCTDVSLKILSQLRYHIGSTNLIARITVSAANHNPTTQATADLLNKIYSGNTPIRKIEARSITSKAQRHCKVFFQKVSAYIASIDVYERTALKASISNDLVPKTEFISILAWHIIDKGLASDFSSELQALGY